MVQMESVACDHPELVGLVDELQAMLDVLDGEKTDFFRAHNRLDSVDAAVIARVDGVAVGCGALRKYDDEMTEIKRMYVKPEHRGRGVARAVLAELESIARARGCPALILETSCKLPNAVRLYENYGFVRMPKYGDYVDVPESICMKKPL